MLLFREVVELSIGKREPGPKQIIVLFGSVVGNDVIWMLKLSPAPDGS